MIDLCLIFPDEATATSTLEGNTYAAVDVIGTIEGVAGWHVNVRHTEEMPELAAYAVFPTTPVRVWF